ncbi:MAG: DoxX family protein [Maribacter sp.]|nr:MAG: DoxX family protein [Maribacter sp.]
MNPQVFMALRILFGLFVLAFGLNKFYSFIPMDNSAMSEAAMGYMGSMASSRTMFLVGVVEVLAGLAFLLNKYGALMALILMSVSINAVLFHITLAPSTIIGSLILLILNIAMLIGYRNKYRNLLN